MDVQKIDEMKKKLNDDGYYVVRGALDFDTCEALESGFWEWMEATSPGIKRNERETWTKENVPLNARGLIQHYNVAFQRFAVDAHVRIKPTFEALYGTEALTTSFDGVSFTKRSKRPRFANFNAWNETNWETTAVHIDQTTPGFSSVQGGLALTTQREDEHTFVCVPGSHKYHDDVMRIAEENARKRTEKKRKLDPSAKNERVETHWLVMSPEHVEFLKSKNATMTRIPLERGDFVMWDSRTVHSSASYCATAPETAYRLQIFVCMRPNPEFATEERRRRETDTRRKAYETGRVSKHSVDAIRLFGKTPRIYSTEDKKIHESMRIQPSCEMTEAEKRLYGLL